tara:strand:- start:658 stop:909 length:252 start_codon:yes stop_codon:yes gene_type:complete
VSIKNLLFDRPGKATTRPKKMDIKAARSDNCIVAEKPPNKNLIFTHPDFVEGSITYHPHVPGADSQLHNNNVTGINIKVMGFI